MGKRDLGVLANAAVPGTAPDAPPVDSSGGAFAPRALGARRLVFAVARGTTPARSEFNTLDLSPRFELSE